MATSMWPFSDNVKEGLNKDKCKYCRSIIEYVMAKESTPTFKCIEYNKPYDKTFKEDSVIETLMNSVSCCEKCLSIWMHG